VGINVLLIGETKTGKTAALETLPFGVVDFSFDIGGWHTLGRRGKKVVTGFKTLREWIASPDKPILKEDEVLVIDYSVMDLVGSSQATRVDATLVTQFITDINSLWSAKDECVARGVRHLSADSLTSLQRPIIEAIMAWNARVIATMQDWGQAINKIDEIVQSCVALPFDFVMTCHIQAEKDEVTGKVKEVPLVYGKQLPNMLLAKFDDIFLSVRERTPEGVKFYWGTSPEGLLHCIGTRNFDNLPIRIEPNFAKLYGERLFKG
jgi:hypothetical protein